MYGVSQLSVERRNGTCGELVKICNKVCAMVASILTCILGCNESHRVELPEHNITMPFDRVINQTFLLQISSSYNGIKCVGATTKCYPDCGVVCVQR